MSTVYAPIQLTIVTPEKPIVQEVVEQLQIPGGTGYFGVLPGHAPLFSELKIGVVSFRKGTQWFYVAVAWGFAEVLPDQVRILAEVAERGEDIDTDRARRAKERAEEAIARGGDHLDYHHALIELERAVARLLASSRASDGA